MLARLIIVTFFLSGAAVQAQALDEWMVQAPRPELKVGFQDSRDRTMIVERIPPGESVENWSRMVTTQRFADAIANGVTLKSFFESFLGGLNRNCPGYRFVKPVYSNLDGYRAVAFRVDCPLNPATRKPEVFLLRAFSGATDLHVVQVAFRHIPSAAETQWAQKHLASASICNRRSRKPACRTGP